MYPHAVKSRLFVCLLPGAAEQAAFADHSRKWRWRRGSRLTRPPFFHLSLQGLHPIALHHQPHLIEEALAEVPFRPLELRMTRAATWSKVAVLQPESPAGILALRARLQRSLRQRGILHSASRGEPHVTLAWRPQDACPPEVDVCIPWTATEFVLVRSWSMSDGSLEYDLLGRHGANALADVPAVKAPMQARLF